MLLVLPARLPLAAASMLHASLPLSTAAAAAVVVAAGAGIAAPAEDSWAAYAGAAAAAVAASAVGQDSGAPCRCQRRRGGDSWAAPAANIGDAACCRRAA